METFWLLGHDKLQSMNRLSPVQMEEIFESVYEPEFLQIIWKRTQKIFKNSPCFRCRDNEILLTCFNEFLDD